MQKLGQHFLTNKIKLQKIAEVLDLKSGDAVIEIGPGHGELTEVLALRLEVLGKNWKIIAIEKDKNLAEFIKKKFVSDKNIEIIQGDALKILPDLCSRFHDSSFKIVGNIPFYITGFLLRSLGELEPKPELIVLTVQKEVAERICTLRQAQGKPKMNLLAASVQFWAEPEIIDYIPKTDFQPQPKVDSAIIKLKSMTTNMRPHANCHETTEEDYYRLIKIIFKQPRKTILNNLASSGKNKEEIIKILEELKINPADRPQNLTIERIKKLAEQFMV